jgi:hypothetical protein
MATDYGKQIWQIKLKGRMQKKVFGKKTVNPKPPSGI